FNVPPPPAPGAAPGGSPMGAPRAPRPINNFKPRNNFRPSAPPPAPPPPPAIIDNSRKIVKKNRGDGKPPPPGPVTHIDDHSIHNNLPGTTAFAAPPEPGTKPDPKDPGRGMPNITIVKPDGKTEHLVCWPGIVQYLRNNFGPVTDEKRAKEAVKVAAAMLKA